MCKKQLAENRLIIAVVIPVIIISLCTISCTKVNRLSKDGVLEITEKMFIAQVNDVYLNAEDYLGKTIKLEGMFKIEQFYEEEPPYYYVLRYGPGCCGSDGDSGFEVRWNNPYPAAESWVSATGVLKLYTEDDNFKYLYLDLSSLDVLSRRGAEMVFQ